VCTQQKTLRNTILLLYFSPNGSIGFERKRVAVFLCVYHVNQLRRNVMQRKVPVFQGSFELHNKFKLTEG